MTSAATTLVTWASREEAQRYGWIHWYGQGPFAITSVGKNGDVQLRTANGNDMGFFAREKVREVADCGDM